MTEPILKIENLSLRREERQILNDVNLEIYPGQVHALLGLNGSGKSSLAYTMMGCEAIRQTKVAFSLKERILPPLSITQRARLGITLAWQEPARFEGIPVGKYVGLGVNPPDRERVIQALEAVALPPKVYGYRSADKTLSGGERKRVELAAVYAMRPRLAILDEPDSGIDILSLGEIANLIRRMAIEGVAVFLITHRDELVETADVVSLICAGTILFSGKPLEARRYFTGRCIPHLEALGAQPWDTSKPEVQEALASNGLLNLAVQMPLVQTERRKAYECCCQD